MSTLYTSGLNVKIIHKWIERLKMSTLCPNGHEVKNINNINKWLTVKDVQIIHS